jgi:hypothetical protein
LAGKEKSISGCEQTAGTLQWDTMSVSSVKLGEFEIYQFGGNRRFFKHQFADAQSGDVLPTFEPGPNLAESGRIWPLSWPNVASFLASLPP